VGAVVLMPLVYGFFGLVFGALGAFVYNLVSGFAGGLELELEAGTRDPRSGAGDGGE
jgi:hypothetical protein